VEENLRKPFPSLHRKIHVELGQVSKENDTKGASKGTRPVNKSTGGTSKCTGGKSIVIRGMSALVKTLGS